MASIIEQACKNVAEKYGITIKPRNLAKLLHDTEVYLAQQAEKRNTVPNPPREKTEVDLSEKMGYGRRDRRNTGD